jgi:hypothetical protein
MLQGHPRYITSHLLPVIVAIGVQGGEVLRAQPKNTRHLCYGLLFAVLLVLQVLVDLKKATL